MIRTRDLFYSLVLAKGISLAVAYFYFGAEADPAIFSLLSHSVSLCIFSALLLLTAKASFPQLLKVTELRSVGHGNLLVWLILAVPLGLIFRFGSEGVVLVSMHLYDPVVAQSEFGRVVSECESKGAGMSLGLIAAALVGAVDEEFVYRRVFQWNFCEKYGALRGVAAISLLFGVIHLNPVALVAACALSLIYIASGRLWVAIIAHAVGNLLHPMFRPYSCALEWEKYLLISAVATFFLCVVALICILYARVISPIYGINRWKIGQKNTTTSGPT